MQVNLCFGCMEPTDSYPCPHCGYTPSQKGAEWALQPGSILNGKYMVGRILGQGGFGITYIGWDIALEKKVAVKEYYPSGQVGRTPGTNALSWYTSESAALARQTGLEMFLKEARKMSKVDDVSGIVRVRDLFQENQTAYIVMDYVEGETLKARLQKTGPMAWDQAKGIFQPAIRAMEQVHKAGLIHRDLSPDNLMLTKDGQVFILDLGAAKDLNINTGASSMQVAKSGFSPFEQYSQRGGSGPWTDVYAMAATVYYTLTGVLPPAAIDRVEEDTMDWSLVSTLPERAREALRAAMAVSVKKRTQSMEELEKGLFGKETPAQIEQPKASKKPIRKKWLLPAAIAVCLTGMVAGIVGLPKPKRTVQAAPSEAAQIQKSTQDSDVNSLIGTYLSRDGEYALIIGEEGKCYLKLVSSNVTYNGQFTLDGTNLQMHFTNGPKDATGTATAGGLVVSCDYFSPKAFALQNLESDPVTAEYTSVDGEYAFSLKTDGSCYWTSADTQTQYTGVYSNNGTSFTLYFQEGPGVVSATKVAGRLLLTCDLFAQKPFQQN